MASVYNGKAENQALWIQKNFKFIKNKHTEQSAFQSIMNYSWFNFLTNDFVIIFWGKEIMFWVCYPPTFLQDVLKYTVFSASFPKTITHLSILQSVVINLLNVYNTIMLSVHSLNNIFGVTTYSPSNSKPTCNLGLAFTSSAILSFSFLNMFVIGDLTH